VLRLWLAPWVDEDGDLHDQAYLYVMWHRGEWQLPHTEAGIRRQFAPVSAPKLQPAGATDAASLRQGARQKARDTVLEAARPGREADNDDR
jgi:hypothetical protein